MPVSTIKEFVVSLENKPGTLADVATALGRAGVNITGFQLQAQGDFGAFRFTAANASKAEDVLKTAKQTYRIRDAVAVTAANKPGELGRLAHKLGGSGVNIEATYHVFLSDTDARILFSVDDVGGATKVLG